MGKRKKAAKKPTGPKRVQNEPLSTIFPCLFCNHEKSVTTKLDKKAGVGQLSCKVCGQKFQCGINYLSAPVDVYSDWVDACEVVEQEGKSNSLDADSYAQSATTRPTPLAKAKDDYDSDNGVDGGYGGVSYSGEGIVADDDDY